MFQVLVATHGLPRDVNYPGQTVKIEYTEATLMSKS